MAECGRYRVLVRRIGSAAVWLGCRWADIALTKLLELNLQKIILVFTRTLLVW